MPRSWSCAAAVPDGKSPPRRSRAARIGHRCSSSADADGALSRSPPGVDAPSGGRILRPGRSDRDRRGTGFGASTQGCHSEQPALIHVAARPNFAKEAVLLAVVASCIHDHAWSTTRSANRLPSSMVRKGLIFLAIGLLMILGAALSRQFVAIVGPRSPREMLATMSGLPLPWFLSEATGSAECGGLACMDYTMQASSSLSPSACKRALAAAPGAGYKPVQAVDSAMRRFGYGASLPSVGFYRYRRPGPQQEEVVWLDSAKCVLTAKYWDT